MIFSIIVFMLLITGAQCGAKTTEPPIDYDEPVSLGIPLKVQDALTHVYKVYDTEYGIVCYTYRSSMQCLKVGE